MVKWWRGVQVISNDDMALAARVAVTLEQVGDDPDNAENSIIKTKLTVSNMELEDGGKYKCQVTELPDSSVLDSPEEFLLIQKLDAIDPILWRSASTVVLQRESCRFQSSAFPTDLTPVTLEWVDSTGAVLSVSNQPTGVVIGATETSYNNVQDTATGYDLMNNLKIYWDSTESGHILTCRVTISYPEATKLSETVHITDLCAPAEALGTLSCEPCAEGTWSVGEAALECTTCGDGKTVAAGVGTSGGDCACVAGTKLENSACVECALGKYSPGGSTTSCSECPVGSAAPKGSASVGSCMCFAGHFLDSTTDDCTACEEDSYSAGGEVSECVTCEDVTDLVDEAVLKQQPLYKELCESGAGKLISYLSLIVAFSALFF